MRRLLKFFHTIGAIGLMGAMVSLLVFISATPLPTSSAAHTLVFFLMAKVTTWIFLPSLVCTLISGLLAIAVNPAYHDAGWAWAKAATGILIFEGGLHALGPIQDEAKRSLSALSGQLDPAAIKQLIAAEQKTLWVMLAVTTANVALGVWRPRFPRLPV